MDLITENLLTILILLPVIGSLAVIGHQMFWKQEGQLKWVALIFTLLNFLVSLFLLGDKGAGSASGFFFEKNVPWIEAINTNYHVGVDGLSLWLVILTTFIMPIAVVGLERREKKQTAFTFLCCLRVQCWVFVSLDLLVFYLF